jgi:hypothetical protein
MVEVHDEDVMALDEHLLLPLGYLANLSRAWVHCVACKS